MRFVLLLLVPLAACDPDLAPAPAPPDPAFVHIGVLNPFSGREAGRAIVLQRPVGAGPDGPRLLGPMPRLRG